MAIPMTVETGMISGVPGEIAFHGPTRVRTAVIDSADNKNNVFGRAYTIKDGEPEAGVYVQAGGAGHFAGIMISPKAYNLDKELNGTQGEFLDMGEVYVRLESEGAKFGDKVYFVPATGELTTEEEGNTLVPNCIVERNTPSAEQPTLAVIRLTN